MLLIWTVIVLLIEYTFERPQGILFDNFVGYKYPSSNRTKARTEKREEIIFPQDLEESVEAVYRINDVPKCTNGLQFCENVDSYPYNYLKRVLERNTLLKTVFGQDEISTKRISERYGDAKENFLCRSITKTIFPKVGQNKNNKWKFIINQGKEDGFVQGVQIEICRNPDGHCDFPGSLAMESGYQIYCKQKYVYRRLLSLDYGGMPVSDTFKIPSACCCAYKRNVDFLTRFGIGFTPVKKNN